MNNNTMPLVGKKILLFAVYTFNYQNIIFNKLVELGAEVYLYDERSVSSSYEKAILKIDPHFFKNKTRKYYREILEKHNNEHFDYILFIKCDMPDKSILNEIKMAFPEAKMCLHVWDSLRNIPHIHDKVGCFDHCTSFDRKDCLNYPVFKFRPLFYSDDFVDNKPKDKSEYLYDVSFCGTIHSDRFKILKSISEQCIENDMKYYGFHYLQSKFVYYFFKLLKKEFKNTKINDFNFDKKTTNEIARIVDSSRAVVDVHHPNQTGLTMRTIEMLGMKKKFITTNTDIVNYDFYNSVNICVIDRCNPVIDKNFFQNEYQEIDIEIYRKYSLNQWIFDVLDV